MNKGDKTFVNTDHTVKVCGNYFVPKHSGAAVHGTIVVICWVENKVHTATGQCIFLEVPQPREAQCARQRHCVLAQHMLRQFIW